MEPFITAKAAKQWNRLSAMQRGKAEEWFSRLSVDPLLGDRLQKSRIPRSMHCPNLWRLPLPQGWRMLYTVIGLAEDVTQVVILWIGTHKEYDRLFGYRTS